MEFFLEGDMVGSDLTFGENHAGWEHLVHGGLLTTVLDEIMGWAVIVFLRRLIVTKSMDVRFIRPVPVGSPVKALGWIESDLSGQGCRVRSVLEDTSGRPHASATADMIYLSKKRAAAVPEPFKSDTLAIFARMEELVANRTEPCVLDADAEPAAKN